MIITNAAFLKSLLLNLDGSYDIGNNFPSPYPSSGDKLLIHVRAKYRNGYSIDECKTLILPQVNGANISFSYIASEFNGLIEDYSPSTINYQIDVYLLP